MKHYRPFRAGLTAFIAAGFLLVSQGVAHAYDKDTHFALTYYLALKLGYHPTDALMIASTDLAVDQDPKTEPLNPFNPFVLGDFHAFAGSLDSNRAAAQIARREQELWQLAVQIENPGILLHFVQDKYSHKGFMPPLGQGLSGHWPDYISANKERATAMAQATADYLSKFMREVLKEEPRKLDPKEIERLINVLTKANPVAKVLIEPSYERAQAAIADELGETTPTPIDFRFDKDGKVRIGYDDSVPKRTDTNINVVVAPSGGKPASASLPASPGRPGRTPTSPSVGGAPARIRAPSRLSSPPAPAAAPARSPAGSVPSGGTPLPPSGDRGIQPVKAPVSGGPGTSPVRIVYDDGPPKTSAPKGVVMRIGIDRGTMQRVTASPVLISGIRADKE